MHAAPLMIPVLRLPLPKQLLRMLLWSYTVLHFLHGAYAHQGAGDFYLILHEVRTWVATGKPWLEFLACSPLHAILMLPLSRLEDSSAVLLMHGGNLLCLAGILWVLGKLFPAFARNWVYTFPLVLNYRPLLCALSMAKIELVEVLLLSLALLYRQKRPIWSGFLLGAGAMIKYLPGVLLLPALVRKEKGVLLGATCAVLPLTLVSIYFYGPRDFGSYVENLAFGFSSWIENQSLHAALYRLFADEVTPYPVSAHPHLAGALAFLGRGGAMVLLLSRCGTMAWIAALPLLVGFFRDYYAVYFLIPYAYLLEETLQRRLPGSRVGLALFSYLLIGQGLPLSLVCDVERLHLYLYWSIPLVGAGLLLSSLVPSTWLDRWTLGQLDSNRLPAGVPRPRARVDQQGKA